MPLAKLIRDGAQSGLLQIAWVNTIPRAASRSKLGVRTQSAPSQPSQSGRCWSAMIISRLGRVAGLLKWSSNRATWSRLAGATRSSERRRSEYSPLDAARSRLFAGGDHRDFALATVRYESAIIRSSESTLRFLECPVQRKMTSRNEGIHWSQFPGHEGT